MKKFLPNIGKVLQSLRSIVTAAQVFFHSNDTLDFCTQQKMQVRLKVIFLRRICETYEQKELVFQTQKLASL